jgi:hypothetical protein
MNQTNILIGVVCDGLSDYDVLQKLITAIFVKHHNIELTDNNFLHLKRLNIRNETDKYFDDSKRENKYGVHTDSAKEYQQSLSAVILQAYSSLKSEKATDLSNSDIIIINTDAEIPLRENDNYFKEWYYSIHNVIGAVIEQFYDKMQKEYVNYDYLPIILPIVPFPAIEILVASTMDSYNENYRTFEAKPRLKQEVWGTDHIPIAYDEGYLQEVLKEYMTPENIAKIYQHIPEARKFIQILAFAPH